MTQGIINGWVYGGQSQITSFPAANQSAFGTLETNELTPVMQGDFVYGLNTQIWQSAQVTGTGAQVDVSDGRLRIQCGTSATGYAFIQTRSPAKYRAGQGITARFTPLFSTGTADNIQAWGMGAVQGGNLQDGYFFAYNGASYGIYHYNRGTGTFYPQSSWTDDKLDGSAGTEFTLNPVNGYPMMIKYPYLGYGNITFWVQNPDTSGWVLTHTIKYAGTSAGVQLGNPSLYFMGFNKNSGNTTNRTMYCGSYGIFLSGQRSFIGNPKWGWDNNKSGITTETNLLTIKNATTYNGVSNRGLIRLTSVSFSSSAASGICNLRFRGGATVGGSPSFTTINGTSVDGGNTITNGNSIASYDTAGTTTSGGTYFGGIALENPGNTGVVDLTPYDLFIAPGESLSLCGFSTNTAQLSVALTWSEDI